MHPEVVRDAPGDCPICGMALEPRRVTLEEVEDVICRNDAALLGEPRADPAAVVIAMGEMFWGAALRHALDERGFGLTQLALATPVVLWGGWPFFERAWRSFRTLRLNMYSLIGLGVAVAYFFSFFAVLAPGALPETFKAHGFAPLYFEAAAVITTLVLLGEVLELRARAHTSSAVRALLGLAPNTAMRIERRRRARSSARRGAAWRQPARAAGREDSGRWRSGRGPLGCRRIDAHRRAGAGREDAGSTVTAGTVNQTGTFLIRAEKVGADTLLAQIAQW